jgi:drug/metabolite transporter (DMT)-like permease
MLDLPCHDGGLSHGALMSQAVEHAGPEVAAIPAPDERTGGVISWPALAAVLIWSGTAPIAKYAIAEFPVLAYMVLRPIIASILLFALLFIRRESILLPKADLRRIALVGVFGLGLSQLTYLGGLSRTSVAHVVILGSISPLLVAVYRLTFKRARLPGLSILGIVGGFLGVILLVVGAGSGSGVSLVGDALAVVSAIAWMGVTIWPARIFARHGTIKPMAWMFLSSLMLTGPIGLPSLHRVVQEPPTALAWASLFYAAVFGALIGNALWQRSVQSLGPSRTLIYLYLQPLGAILLAAVLLGEPLNAMQAAGGLLALVGVGFVRRE